MNTTKQLYASYMLYHAIFLEQSFDHDTFGAEEQSAITNIAQFSYLGLYAFLDQKQHIMNTQNFIKDNYPLKLKVPTLDTLQDMIALDNNIREHLGDELKYYSALGTYLYKEHQSFFQEYTLSHPEELFSSTMFCYEALLILDQCDYDINDALEDIKDHEYEKEITAILKVLEL